MFFAAEFSTSDVLLAIFVVFVLLLLVWLVISIFIDIIHSDDLSGWGKAMWSALIVFIPFLGVFAYLIARGFEMSERQYRAAQEKGRRFWMLNL